MTDSQPVEQKVSGRVSDEEARFYVEPAGGLPGVIFETDSGTYHYGFDDKWVAQGVCRWVNKLTADDASRMASLRAELESVKGALRHIVHLCQPALNPGADPEVLRVALTALGDTEPVEQKVSERVSDAEALQLSLSRRAEPAALADALIDARTAISSRDARIASLEAELESVKALSEEKPDGDLR